VGKLSVKLPSPYEIQAPMLGKPGSTKPVHCMNVAGPWTLDFEAIEWMKAMSSTQLARCGSRSLTHLPHLPCCRHCHGLFRQLPGTDWNSSTLPPGSNFWPCLLMSKGL